MDPAKPRTSELLARVTEAWRPFRDAAFARGAGGLAERIAGGWTYKEMLAHVAAWHDLTTKRLDALRRTGESGPPAGPDASRVFDELGFRPEDRDALVTAWDFDRFNAAVAAVAQDRDPTEVLRSLDRSFADVTTAIGALSDEQAAAHLDGGKSFVYALVEGNTFDHYAQHGPELGL